MVKVFVSQPMAGRSPADIEGEREGILEFARQVLGECREVPSYFGPKASQMSPLECLGKSIELMSHADVAFFAPGWGDARGCRVERLCAEEYGVRVVDLDEA